MYVKAREKKILTCFWEHGECSIHLLSQTNELSVHFNVFTRCRMHLHAVDHVTSV